MMSDILFFVSFYSDINVSDEGDGARDEDEQFSHVYFPCVFVRFEAEQSPLVPIVWIFFSSSAACRLERARAPSAPLHLAPPK